MGVVAGEEAQPLRHSLLVQQSRLLPREGGSDVPGVEVGLGVVGRGSVALRRGVPQKQASLSLGYKALK